MREELRERIGAMKNADNYARKKYSTTAEKNAPVFLMLSSVVMRPIPNHVLGQ